MPDVLEQEAREGEAVRKLGAWRDRIKLIVLLIGAGVGVVAGGVAYYVVQELQFRHNHGVAFIKLNVIAFAVVWLLVMLAARFASRVVLDRRTPAKLEELAQAYNVPVAKLAEIAAMVRKL